MSVKGNSSVIAGPGSDADSRAGDAAGLASASHATLRVLSPALRSAFVGAGALVGLAAMRLLDDVSLSHDAEYDALLKLMWYGSEHWLPIVGAIFRVIHGAVLGLGVASLLAACWVPVQWTGLRSRLTLATALGTIFGLTAQLKGRLFANFVYAVRTDAKPWVDGLLSRVEGPIIAHVQVLLDGEVTRMLAAFVYSLGWLAVLLGALPIALLTREWRLMVTVAIGPLLVTLAAVPIHIVLPVHDPWSLNPEYGFVAGVQTTVRYLFPAGDSQLLLTVANEMRTVVASCLPSLHVALPAFMGATFYGHGQKALGLGYWMATVVVAWATIFLGRHWIADAVVAIVLAALVERVCRKVLARWHAPWASA